jgi:hypothetical protein
LYDTAEDGNRLGAVMAAKLDKLSKQIQKLNENIRKDVDKILAEEAKGEEDAFADWLHIVYLGGLDGEKLVDFEEFKESPLAADMIADWKYDCTSHADRVELLNHILGRYAAEDFEEQEHFDKDGHAILCYGEPDEEHFDKDGKPIAPYVLALDREPS